MKKAAKIIGIIALVLLVIAAGYVIYVFASFTRLPDNLELDIVQDRSDIAADGRTYTLLSWNLGFGAYSDDYTFFMDGGTESRARSADAARENISAALDKVRELSPDFCMLEEIDVDATRTYHVDERAMVLQAMDDYGAVYAQNYDSPYLFYPFTQPHGASRAGLMTLSGFHMESATRRSLPIESGVTKVIDLDRCYSISRIPLDSGKKLCLYCAHLSAYTSDGTIADEQIKMLAADMQKDYEAGNYVICGGDFNKDLLGDSGAIFGVSGEDYTWAQPFPEALLGDDLSLIAPLDADDPVPSCRNADIPYEKGKSFVVTVDGFIVSRNVTVEGAEVIDTGFLWSDHNPVRLTFKLGE